jgi:hypothetical protein
MSLSKKIKFSELNDIDKEIAIEFGLEAIGFGGNRITEEQLKAAQIKFSELSQEKQDEIVLAWFRKLV